MDKIKFQSDSVTELISEFKKQMDKMDNLSNKLKEETTNMKSVWEGIASDDVLSKIDEFKKVFDEVKTQNEKYVNSLNIIIEKYSEEENSNIDAVNNNVDSYDFEDKEGD